MTYSSARQLAGLSCAGTLVTLVALAFLYQLPSSFFPFHGGPFYADWAALCVVYLAYALVSLPFDVWAGYRLPRRHLGELETLSGYLGRLVRGLCIHGAVVTASALILLKAGQWWGVWGAEGALAIILTALYHLRSGLASLLGRGAAPAPLCKYYAAGGLWLLVGFALSASLPWCGVQTLFGLLETLLGCTLWTLPGLFILKRLHPDASCALQYLSWGALGLLSRAMPNVLGLPERWAAPAAP